MEELLSKMEKLKEVLTPETVQSLSDEELQKLKEIIATLKGNIDGSK